MDILFCTDQDRKTDFHEKVFWMFFFLLPLLSDYLSFNKYFDISMTLFDQGRFFESFASLLKPSESCKNMNMTFLYDM